LGECLLGKHFRKLQNLVKNDFFAEKVQYYFRKKCARATFWAMFSQNHLVALIHAVLLRTTLRPCVGYPFSRLPNSSFNMLLFWYYVTESTLKLLTLKNVTLPTILMSTRQKTDTTEGQHDNLSLL
jgi:ABC-type glycerol-3-phosphate transport system permease component